MPQALAIIPLIAGLAGTGVSIGESLANRPGMPKAPATPAGPTPAQQKLTQQQEQAAISQQLPNIAEQGSGFTNPAYDAMMASLRAGTAGQPGNTSAANQAVAQLLGLPGTPQSFTPTTSTSNTAVPPSPTALSDFVNTFFRG
jgi:hypothetical protein